MKRHRYRQEALPLPGSKPSDYSPTPQQLAGPVQGWLALDGGALGPLFNNHTTTTTKENTMAISLTDIKEAFFNPATGKTTDAVHPITGLGLWSGLSHDELNTREGAQLERLSMDEAERRQLEADRQRYCKGPQPITSERAGEMLDCLPPYRWANHGTFELFAVGEPLTGDLVTWFVRIGRQWFELNEERSITADKLLGLCRAA